MNRHDIQDRIIENGENDPDDAHAWRPSSADSLGQLLPLIPAPDPAPDAASRSPPGDSWMPESCSPLAGGRQLPRSVGSVAATAVANERSAGGLAVVERLVNGRLRLVDPRLQVTAGERSETRGTPLRYPPEAHTACRDGPNGPIDPTSSAGSADGLGARTTKLPVYRRPGSLPWARRGQQVSFVSGVGHRWSSSYRPPGRPGRHPDK